MSNVAKVALGDICEVNIGRTPARENREYWGVGFPWLSIADMNQGRVLSKTKEQITHRAVVETRMQPAPTGTVLLSFKLSIGKVGIAATPLFTNEAIAALPIKDSTKLIPEFLFWALQSIDLTAGQDRAAMGLTLNKAKLLTLQIPVPPLEEQRRIAAILDQAETLRTQRRTALALLDSLTQSLFLDMFGDPVANPKGWPMPKFGEVGKLDRGISKHRPRNAPELLGGKHPLVQTGEVANCDGYIRSYTSTYSDLGLRQSKMWPAGTLCITIAANIAKTGILTFDACFPDSVVGFQADDSATVEYVRVWLSFLQKALEDSAPESAQKNINLAILRGLSIPLPPLPLQQTFAIRIASIEALKATHRRALAALDALFASLQQRAFRGELTPAARRAPAQSLAQLQQLEASIGQEALIFIAKRMPDGDLYNSLKAIYFADRHHLEHHGRQIYNETYSALTHGPVPQAAYDATNVLIGKLMFSSFDDDAVRAALRRKGDTLTALRDADFSKLSRAVIESLEWSIRYCRDMKFGQTKTASHDSAYERTPKNEAIPLQYIIDTLPPEARQRHWNL